MLPNELVWVMEKLGFDWPDIDEDEVRKGAVLVRNLGTSLEDAIQSVDIKMNGDVADVLVYSRPEGGLFVAKDESGGLVYAFTDEEKAAASGHDQFATMSGRDLAAALPAGVRIGLNPGSDVSVAIAPADIVAVR